MSPEPAATQVDVFGQEMPPIPVIPDGKVSVDQVLPPLELWMTDVPPAAKHSEGVPGTQVTARSDLVPDGTEALDQEAPPFTVL